jgi:hypothetical protein
MSASDPRRLIDEARQVLEGTTEGPWANQVTSGMCRIDEPGHRHGQGQCDYRIWSYDHPNAISRVFPEGTESNEQTRDDALVAGMWDYDSGGVYRQADAAFIVWSRNHLPALCDALEDALKQVETLTREVEGWRRGELT